MKILSFIFIVFVSVLSADLSNDEKVNILTDYLVKQENKEIQEARNEAIATIYGKPIFDQLSYDDDTEMFFGKVKSSKTSMTKKVNFYMPKQRAHSFKKNLDNGNLEVKYTFKDNGIELSEIELEYEGVKYPMAIKTDTTMSLKIGGYFTARQDTKISAEKNGIGGTLDLQELFNLKEDTSSFRVDLGYEFSQKHKMTASYYAIRNSNTRTVAPFDFAGKNIGGDVNLEFNTNIYKLTYVYSAYRTNKFEFNTRLGVHITKFDTILSTLTTVNGETDASEQVNLSIPTPLPVFGLGFNYDITDTLALKYHVDYFYLSAEVKGSMVDTQIELTYMIYDYVGLSLGFNSTKMDFELDIDDTKFGLDHDISGVLASVVFRY